MNRKYNVNDLFFENIDNENKAYWLGFLLADGNINVRKGQDRLVLDISTKDIKHLEKFKKDIEFDGPINTYTIKSGKFIGKTHCQIAITSQKLVDDLAKLGCVPNKDLLIKYPNIDSIFDMAFIRGNFDGDGSVFLSNEKHWRNNKISSIIHFRFHGTKDLLIEINKKLGLDGIVKQVKQSKSFVLAYKRRKKEILFYNMLYKNAIIFLERKKEIFEQRRSETIISSPNSGERDSPTINEN